MGWIGPGPCRRRMPQSNQSVQPAETRRDVVRASRWLAHSGETDYDGRPGGSPLRESESQRRLAEGAYKESSGLLPIPGQHLGHGCLDGFDFDGCILQPIGARGEPDLHPGVREVCTMARQNPLNAFRWFAL